jgi:hypothetical protein
MTRDDIIKMAKQAKLPYEYDTGRLLHLKEVEHFAALVAAAERKRIESRPWGAGKEWIARAIEAEREACIKVIEAYQIPVGNSRAGELACDWTYNALKQIRDEIKERGEK